MLKKWLFSGKIWQAFTTENRSKIVNYNDNILRITIKNAEPLELEEYIKSLSSLSSEFLNFCQINNIDIDKNVKLYIKEVKSGSIITDLVNNMPAIIPVTIPMFENINIVSDFFGNLKRAFDYLKTGGTRPDNLTKSTLKHISDMVAPNIRDNSGSIKFEIINGDKVINNYFMDNNAQNIIQNKARHEMESMDKEEFSRNYKRVVFYWKQTNNTDKSTSADKGVIEDISKASIKVISSDEIKQKMLEGAIYENYYIVDVRTIVARGKIVAYEIINLIDIVQDPDFQTKMPI